MHKNPLTPFALALICAMPFAAGGADTGLRLKGQSALIPVPPDSKEKTPVFVDADQIRGHTDKETEAEGDARLRRRGQAIFADWLRYDKPEDEVTAAGNVRIEQRGDVVEGPRLKLNLETERGFMESPRYYLYEQNARGTAERLLFEGHNLYRAQNADYTTCEAPNNDWFIRARDLQIDKDRDVGTARDASVLFMGAPIFYSPYLSFSLHQQRKSGFLTPSFSSTGKSGAEFAVPYYWNIAPNRDATFTPRFIAKRGVLVNTELRYLEPDLFGEARLEVLPNDRVRGGVDRHALFLRHQQNLPHGWFGLLNVQKVSDDTYFTDLTTQVAFTSQTVLPREGMLARGGTWWTDGTWGLNVLVQRWQTLQTDPLAPVTPPHSRLPQLILAASKQNVLAADFDFTGNYVDFSHPTLVRGRRVVAYPSLSLPLQTSYAYVTPKLGVHVTRYALDPSSTSLRDQTRTLPIFTTDAGLIFERDAAFTGQRFVQTLEPRIYYVYIPFREQNQLPNFESGLQDINFATIYSENQFGGNDRINDANQVTLGVTSRFINPNDGAEHLRLGVAQRYYFKPQQVTLPGVPARTSTSSDLLATVSGTVLRNWVAEGGWQYNTDFSRTQRLSGGVRYQPQPGQVLNLGYRYTRDVLKQVDISTQWSLRNQWTGLARWNYSIRDNKVLETLAGLEYNAGCWAFRVVAHRFATATQEAVTSIFLQLELNGVSRIGSNPFEVLQQNIAGYVRQDPRPARSHDPFFIPVR